MLHWSNQGCRALVGQAVDVDLAGQLISVEHVFTVGPQPAGAQGVIEPAIAPSAPGHNVVARAA